MRTPPCRMALTILSLLWAINLQAQTAKDLEHTFQSEVFGTERQIRIHLPEPYFVDTTQPFVVTYVLDAQFDEFWYMAKSNISYLVINRQILPMIVVGVVSEDRSAEFRPDGTALRRHLREEVMPWVNAQYRVADFNVLIGHSWAGAFIGSTLFGADRDLFDAYIGISPSLDAYDYVILEQADSILQVDTDLKKFFYCSAGELGYREMESIDGILKMDSLLQEHPNKSLAWEWQQFKGTDHWTCVIPSMNDGLLKMSRNYFADQYVLTEMARNSALTLQEQMELFYQEKVETFGYVYWPGARYLRFVASDLKNTGDLKAAAILYEMVVKEDPDYFQAWFQLADVLDQL
ncbi:MAG: hypothetical protein KDC44_08330, partial [Phaeodactylibacter sp.]|nr:hypothetical protein [Phaeodactylibacter sp.]